MKGLRTPDSIWQMYHQRDTAPLPVLLNELAKQQPYNAYRGLPEFPERRHFEKRSDMSGWHFPFILSTALRRSYEQQGGEGVSWETRTQALRHYPMEELVSVTFVGPPSQGKSATNLILMFSEDAWPLIRLKVDAVTERSSQDFDVDVEITDLPRAMRELRAWSEDEIRARTASQK